IVLSQRPGAGPGRVSPGNRFPVVSWSSRYVSPSIRTRPERFQGFEESMKKLITIFKIPELAQKIGITLLFLVIYRIGFHVPLPFIDQSRMANFMSGAQQGAFGQILGFVSLFSGGTMSQAVIFTWGVMPYISASIIFLLL